MNPEDKARERANRILRMLKEYDPEIKYPGKLTDEILGSIADVAQLNEAGSKKTNKMILLNINFRRLVAAAAILLLGILGYEQYIILNRINQLEIQLEEAAVKKGAANSSPFTQTWETRAIANFRKIKDSNRSLAEKARDVRDMMKTIDRNSSVRADSYRARALDKYNSMTMR